MSEIAKERITDPAFTSIISPVEAIEQVDLLYIKFSPEVRRIGPTSCWGKETAAQMISSEVPEIPEMFN